MDVRRVVVTGTGTVNPLGNSTADTWAMVRAGRSGIRRISKFDPETFTSQVAGEVAQLVCVHGPAAPRVCLGECGAKHLAVRGQHVVRVARKRRIHDDVLRPLLRYLHAPVLAEL